MKNIGKIVDLFLIVSLLGCSENSENPKLKSVKPEWFAQIPGKILAFRNKKIMYLSDHEFVITTFEIDANNISIK